MQRFKVKVSRRSFIVQSFLFYGETAEEVVKQLTDRLPVDSDLTITATPDSKDWWVVLFQEYLPVGQKGSWAWATTDVYGPFDKWTAADLWTKHPKNLDWITDEDRRRYVIKEIHG